jgi:hypothetical protein
MPKNIVIFSDGTGQAGGITFDEDRTNIYKLYRATRCGPDSSVNPTEQVTFYDPGLGSPRDNHFIFGWLGRKIYNLISQATGFGITANIIDCYAALIRLWQPGDRIFLFGFSRGAYTVRCLAAVIANCGIPTQLPNGKDLVLDISSLRKVASYAVKHVYQFTSSRPKGAATEQQLFLLQTRDLIAARFRKEYKSEAANGVGANTYPYFIGVFDTVAALFNRNQFVLLLSSFILIAAFASAVFPFVPFLPFGDHHLTYESYWHNFRVLFITTSILSIIGYVYTHLKFDFQVPGYNWISSLRTIHWAELYLKFYDYTLNPNVPYAKHAISIDENRKDFKRVGWSPGETNRPNRDEWDNIYFEQVWFSGNHADIGGGYAENECRLSDVTLKWMLISATVISNGLKIDPDVLVLHPSPDGPSHDEVKSGFGIITKLTGYTWPEQIRDLPADPKTGISAATMHSSVYKRFDLKSVLQYDTNSRYRPETLRNHVDFSKFYDPGAPFPSSSANKPRAIADDPELRAIKRLKRKRILRRAKADNRKPDKNA